MSTPTEHWYAVAVHARQEKAAAAELTRRGFAVFLPLRAERRAWSDRVQTVELALFPGYLFVRTALTAARRVEMLQGGVVDLVGRKPGDPRIATPVPDEELDALKDIVAAAENLDPVTRLVAGTLVRVASGALKGVRGVIEQGIDGRRRLVVQVTLLGRGVRAELDADDVVEGI